MTERNREGENGEVAVIYDRQDKFLAVGLFDPHSPIRVRILATGKPQTIDDAWIKLKVRQAFALREGMFDESTTGYRCINGESDGLPGMVVDRYGDVLALKLYTTAWLPHLRDVVDAISRRLQPASLVVRLSRDIATVVIPGSSSNSAS